MARIRADRILETSTTTGTGTLTLAGAVMGFRAFSAVCTSPSDTCYYYIEGVDGNGIPTGEWETGLGTYSAANTLTRTTPAAGSAATPVSFSAGTKRVGITLIADAFMPWEQPADVASAGTVSLGEGGYFFITGTTTITDIDFATDKAGRTAWVKFAGALTLTNGANLILPGAADILTAAGDTACFISEGSDVIRCVAYQRAVVAPFTGSYEAGPPTPPTSSDFATWDYQNGSTVTDGSGVMILAPALDATIHSLYKAAPGTPYSVYCRVKIGNLSTAAVTTAINQSAGIMFKDTAGDNERLLFNIQTVRIAGDEQIYYMVVCTRYTGASTPVYVSDPIIRYVLTPFEWIKVDNDGTTFTLSYSFDGKNWITVGTETLAAHIDGAASYGPGALGTTNATAVHAHFSYFSTTAPA